MTDEQHESGGAVHRFSQHQAPQASTAAVAHGAGSDRSSSTPKWLIWSSVIQILLLLFVAFQISGLDAPTGAAVAGGNGGVAPSAAVAGSPQANPPAPRANMAELVDDDAVKGDSEASVTIIEFSDFECPFCGRFYRDTLPQIEEQYIKTGKVKFVYRDFPLSFHPNAQKAAEAAECAAEQGKFWEMHDLLFESGVAGGVTGFKSYAQQLGLDTESFNQCLDSGSMASEVRKDFSDGSAAGVQGTPGFFINGQLVSGAQPFQVFQQVIDAALAG